MTHAAGANGTCHARRAGDLLAIDLLPGWFALRMTCTGFDYANELSTRALCHLIRMFVFRPHNRSFSDSLLRPVPAKGPILGDPRVRPPGSTLRPREPDARGAAGAGCGDAERPPHGVRQRQRADRGAVAQHGLHVPRE